MRLALTSDLHGHLPLIPKCDLLLIAGDLALDKFKEFNYEFPCPRGQNIWLDTEFIPWIETSDAEEAYATLGNHDWVQTGFDRGIIKVDELVETQQGLSIWFSPWSPIFARWSYMLTEEQLEEYYSHIPPGIDILVSHGPPYGYGDKSYVTMIGGGDPHVGSKALLRCIERVKPRIVVCGHIHGGYGLYNCGDTQIYNASLVDENYKPVHNIVEIVI
jgi:Icc-related predicted phosphoesterase